MPSELGQVAGTKVLTEAPGNPERGLPLIQALYVLFDAATLTPRRTIDGSALTAVRTPAVSAVAADRLAAPDASRAVVIGTGTQGKGHARALAEVRNLEDLALIGTNEERCAEAVAELAAEGIPARVGSAADLPDAHIIACATSSPTPVLEANAVADGACVVAVGAAQPHLRELPAQLLGRALVVTEDITAALAENGDITLAIEDGELFAEELHTLKELSDGAVARREDAPNVFTGTGMSWQDLAVAGLLRED